MPGLSIESEIGALRRVVLHSPGPEVEAMTPGEAARDLYNDIIPLAAVRAEHDQLRSFLERVAEVSELEDLLAESLASPGSRFEFLTQVSGLCPVRGRIDELMALPPAELAKVVIEGLPAPPGSLAAALSPRGFSMRPLPNAYFMRDSASVFRGHVISSAAAFDVRLIESIVTRFVFTRHPTLRARGLLLDGPRERNRFVTIEGGDLIVVSRNLLAVGISGRTRPDAVELLAQCAGRAFEEPVTILAVVLPEERATIHLDMVFTLIDRDAALVYEPVVSGVRKAQVLRIEARPDGSVAMAPEEGLLEALRKLGHDLEPVPCGNGDALHAEREQWWSGANSFAFAPGKILMYSCNVHTLEALDAAGFSVRSARDFVMRDPIPRGADGRGGEAGGGEPIPEGRLVVGFEGIELARGGGGARCMTLPVERDPL